MAKKMRKCKHIKDSAKRLCENRSSYNFKENIEKEIISKIKQQDDLVQLIHEIVSLIHGKDGNIRVGAAEILGIITPPSMANIVQKELERHLDDNFVRDYVYHGFQGDEEDMRTVSGCSKLSIKKLNELMTGF
ncbi:MAG: hypothetical protein NTX52_14070 [Planctomycetota bacterium]|nr:hypothetical protein [Planctomycetota bacterium]